MDFNYLGLTNRLLLMAKRTPISSMATSLDTDAYRAQLSVNDAICDVSLLLRIKTRITTFTFDTVAGTRTYAIQKRIIYPFINLRQKNSDLIIRQYHPEDFDYLIPDDDSSGNPEVYYFEEWAGVSNQPASTGEQVYCVSSSSADSSTVVIQGYTSDRYIVDEVTLTGTTAVASTSTFKKIDSISKIATTGTITFRNSGSTTTYLTLAPKEKYARFLVIGLHPVPSGAITIYGRGYIRIPELINEYDIPAGLTDDHVNAITAWAYARFMQYEPKFPSEALDSLFSRAMTETQKIIAMDAKDKIQYHMKPPVWAGRHGFVFRPLNPKGQ